MQRFVFASTAALLVLSASPGRGAAELAFAPKEGLVLEKRATSSGDLELKALKIRVADQEIESEVPEVSNSFSQTLEMTDTYAKVEGGRILRLERSYDDLAQHSASSSPGSETESDDESPLEGATVVFTWNDEDEEYERSTSADVDDGLLEDLEPLLDFEEILPEKEVSEGDSWSLDSETMRAFLAFEGDLHFGDDDKSPQDELINEALEDALEGTVECTYRGTREVDGRELHVIEVELSGEGHTEAESDEEEGLELPVTREVDATLDLKGEVLWDASGGHFARVALEGDLSFTLEERATMNIDGESVERSLAMTFGGPVTTEYQASKP